MVDAPRCSRWCGRRSTDCSPRALEADLPRVLTRPEMDVPSFEVSATVLFAPLSLVFDSKQLPAQPPTNPFQWTCRRRSGRPKKREGVNPWEDQVCYPGTSVAFENAKGKHMELMVNEQRKLDLLVDNQVVLQNIMSVTTLPDQPQLTLQLIGTPGPDGEPPRKVTTRPKDPAAADEVLGLEQRLPHNVARRFTETMRKKLARGDAMRTTRDRAQRV